jgi:predicted Zn-dependent protease with MMP-like domain
MYTVDRATFDQLIEEAWLRIPRRFRRQVHNVSIEVEDHPPKEIREYHGRGLLGLYHGVPLTQRSTMWSHGPDRIVLYKRNLESICNTEEELRHQIRETLLHEIGHYFGMNERQLRDSGY